MISEGALPLLTLRPVHLGEEGGAQAHRLWSSLRAGSLV